MIKKYLRYLRNAAVLSYQNAILNCLEKTNSRVSLLDCGCDDGAWTIKLREVIGDASLFGIEIVEERRKTALSRGVQAVTADLNETFPFADRSMNIIHANQVIEHLHDTDQFVSEIQRVLVHGGYAVICTENLAGWHNIFSLMLGWQPFSLTNICSRKFQIGNPLAIHNHEPGVNPDSWQHMRVFAYQGLKELLQEYGLETEHYQGSGYYPFPGWFGRIDPRHAAFLTIKVRKP